MAALEQQQQYGASKLPPASTTAAPTYAQPPTQGYAPQAPAPYFAPPPPTASAYQAPQYGAQQGRAPYFMPPAQQQGAMPNYSTSAGAPQYAAPAQPAAHFSAQQGAPQMSNAGGPIGYQVPAWAQAQQGYGQAWQPAWPQAQQGYGATPIPQMGYGAQQMGGGAQQQSLNQQALAGAGGPQGISNYIAALRAVGAGGNNAQMTTQAPAQQQSAPLFQQLAASNGAGSLYGYNAGFGAAGGGMNFGALQASPQQQQQEQQSTQQLHQMMGTGTPGASQQPSTNNTFSPGLMTTMSDERTKRDIKPATRDVRSFLGTLGVHSYEYKDAKHGAGRYVSPMAQELAKTELGRSAVVPTPEGLMVDYGRTQGIALSAMSDLHKRLKKLEGKKR